MNGRREYKAYVTLTDKSIPDLKTWYKLYDIDRAELHRRTGISHAVLANLEDGGVSTKMKVDRILCAFEELFEERHQPNRGA